MDPLSLLEVQLIEERVDDDDCIIIDDDSQNNEDGWNVFNNSVPRAEREQVEEDPLHIDENARFSAEKHRQMTSIWITTNISNLASVSPAEAEYRKEKYQNVYEVLNEILHCTVCQDHIGCDIRLHPSSIEHPLLKVLMCSICSIDYRNVNFEQDEKGKDLTCRWCGKTSYKSVIKLRTCEKCPFSFCERCIVNNIVEYEMQPRWTCFVCNIKELWPARGTLWALRALESSLLAGGDSALKNVNRDISHCCMAKKKLSKNKEIAHNPPSLLHNFDLDQLIAPHLLSESAEPHSYSESNDQLLPFVDASMGGCYPTGKGIKPRAKPKPKPKASNSKSKAKKQPASVPKLLVPPTQQNNCVKLKSALLGPPKKPHWLRMKLASYMTDFEQLKTKLKSIEKSIDGEETDEQIENTIGDITTLLSLHGELLETCRMNLSNEWNERKARAVIEKYNPNKQEMNHLNSKMSLNKTNNKRKLNNNAESCVDNQVNIINLEENINHDIKNCFVKLKKLKLPLPIVDNNFSVKLEEINYCGE